MAKGSEENEKKPEIILTLSSTKTSDVIDAINKHTYEAAWNVTNNCNICMRRQEANEKIEDITESNVSLTHMVRTDAREIALMARIYNAPELEKKAIEFALTGCGYNKKRCIEARKDFSEGIFYKIKDALDYSERERKELAANHP